MHLSNFEELQFCKFFIHVFVYNLHKTDIIASNFQKHALTLQNFSQSFFNFTGNCFTLIIITNQNLKD